MSTAIKDCPFCGTRHYLNHITEHADRHYISCECGAVGPVTRERADAIPAWNERTDERPVLGCLVRTRTPEPSAWVFFADLTGDVPQRATAHPDLYERIDVVQASGAAA